MTQDKRRMLGNSRGLILSSCMAPLPYYSSAVTNNNIYGTDSYCAHFRDHLCELRTALHTDKMVDMASAHMRTKTEREDQLVCFNWYSNTVGTTIYVIGSGSGMSRGVVLLG